MVLLIPINRNMVVGRSSKVVMDQLTLDAKSKGIETVRLDAGDFTEGSVYYFSDHGKSVIRAFQQMGYDAAAMGNHDWLMGAASMGRFVWRNAFPVSGSICKRENEGLSSKFKSTDCSDDANRARRN